MSGFSERSIQDMLGEKHAQDVFVRACKSGPSWTGERVRILDGWAMPRSWARPQCVGYEIKLSRSDWLGDKKWPSYLELCHQLYIVCPHGLLKKSEIPDPLGLVYACAGEGRRLITAKKAAVRDVQIPESLFRYVLMNRCQISEHDVHGKQGVDEWRAWLAGKRETRNLGRRCGKRMAKLIELEARADVDRTASASLKKLGEKHQRLLDLLGQHGIYGYSEESILSSLRERLAESADPRLIGSCAKQVRLARDTLDALLGRLNAIDKGEEE